MFWVTEMVVGFRQWPNDIVNLFNNIWFRGQDDFGTGDPFDRSFGSFYDNSFVVCFRYIEWALHSWCKFVPMLFFVLLLDTEENVVSFIYELGVLS